MRQGLNVEVLGMGIARDAHVFLLLVYSLKSRSLEMAEKRYPPGRGKRGNPVAKHARKLNRSVVFRDRNQYRRNVKHKLAEPFPILCLNAERAWEKVFA